MFNIKEVKYVIKKMTGNRIEKIKSSLYFKEPNESHRNEKYKS